MFFDPIDPPFIKALPVDPATPFSIAIRCEGCLADYNALVTSYPF
jgi:hypothetical protein